MKIVFYHSSLKRGGAERVITSLANYFVELGHQISIITIDNNNPEYKINNKIQLIKLSGLKTSKTLWQSIKLNIRLILQVKRSVGFVKPDIIVCFGVDQLFHVYCAAINTKYKIVGSERANPYEDPCGWLKNKMKLYLYHHVDGFIFQTFGAKQFYNSASVSKGCIIQNPISEELEKMPSIKFEQRLDNIFYSFGRLSRAKSYDFLIRSFAKFHNSHEECKLIIYGEGNERKTLEQLIVELNAEEYIFLPGKTEHVFEKMQSAKFFILSSIREGMPNSLLEAMAAGCVCIATDCNFGPSEIIIDGENGLLVKTQSENDMVLMLERVYTNKDLQKNISRNALNNIRNKNSIIQIGDKYLKYFNEICNKK